MFNKSLEFFHYVKPEDALERILTSSNIYPGIEVVDSLESLGRILAEDVISPFSIPREDVAHFDGYAVRSSDTISASTTNPVRLKVVGRVEAIVEHDLSIGDGETVYVVTGTKIPKNADAVIPLERVRMNGEYIEIIKPCKKGDNVTFKGSDILENEVILRRGHVIRPQDIRYLLEIRKFKVKVYAKPRVSLIAVGDELTENLDEIGRKKLETSTKLVASYVKEFGGMPKIIGVVPDNPERILETVKNSLDYSDISVTIGGISLGVRDLCWRTLSRCLESIPIARGLRIQPGRATSILVFSKKPVIMLPGHIQSTLCGTIYTLIPLIYYMSGLSPKKILPTIHAKMDETLIVKEYRSFKRIRFVKLDRDGDTFTANPILGDSSMLTPILKSDGFIEIPEGVERIERGSCVDVQILSWPQLLQIFLRDHVHQSNDITY
ncbi:MAG: molybdopterin molybdotransferase MoeA [Aigarchaeota archaeon]|nr:molybdopterin molybdotransferase MoeA [Aigarchaeota archaeon]MCX8192423.1 molybdopterin molybdotransferase MoeA [Nitrososphaeria archaeon]